MTTSSTDSTDPSVTVKSLTSSFREKKMAIRSGIWSFGSLTSVSSCLMAENLCSDETSSTHRLHKMKLDIALDYTPVQHGIIQRPLHPRNGLWFIISSTNRSYRGRILWQHHHLIHPPAPLHYWSSKPDAWRGVSSPKRSKGSIIHNHQICCNT